MDIKMDSQTADAVEMHEHETKGASEGDVSKKTKRVRKSLMNIRSKQHET